MDVTGEVLMFLFFLGLSATFGMTETAFVSVNLLRAKRLKMMKAAGAEALVRLRENPRNVLATILLWNNASAVTASAIATLIFTNAFGEQSLILAVGSVTLLLLLFGDITPKTFATAHADRIALLVAPSLEVLTAISNPIVSPLEAIARVLTRSGKELKTPLLTEDDLDALVLIGVEEGTVGQNEARLVRDALDFNDHLAKQVMTPTAEIEYFPEAITVSKALAQATSSPHYRFPVRDKHGKIIGVVTEKGLLSASGKGLGKARVTTIMLSPIMVGKDTPISHVFELFQKRNRQMAMVTNEHSHVIGIITLEDIIGKLVDDLRNFDTPRLASGGDI
jgi:CBS domain containing-hemolysin-like protein